MTGKPAARDCDHPTYPEYEDVFGEDPARFLYHLNPQPRIRGITNPELLRAYLNVEAERDEPRRSVIAACNARLKDLEQPTADTVETAAVATDGGEPQ